MPVRPLTIVCLMLLTAIASNLPAADAPAGTPQPKADRRDAFAKIDDVPSLPRVLLIGDSISIGYTLDVRELLEGKANVHRIPTNGGPTTNGLANIDKWLGDGQWDVIHFNWGLHDLKYCDDKGVLQAVGEGHQQVLEEAYAANLEQLVTRLEQTGAKLVFATTTPVPNGAKGRVPADAPRYNAAALKIMTAHEWRLTTCSPSPNRGCRRFRSRRTCASPRPARANWPPRLSAASKRRSPPSPPDSKPAT
ncbi:MAG: SGNH/GDSL hydrolase family protein [Planctomycetaceae bacterium]